MKGYKSIIVIPLLISLTLTAFSTFTQKKEIRPNLVMSWKLEGTKSIRFLFEKMERGHAWIGPGISMFSGSVFRIAKINGGNDLEVKECKLIGTVTPDCSGQQNFLVTDKQATPTSFKVEILRDLITGDPNDSIIYQAENKFIWSVTSNDTPEMHGTASERGVIMINLNTGTVGGPPQGLWGDGTFMIHGHGHLLLWTVFADSLIIIGKYWKGLNRYFDIHAVTFFFLVILNVFLSKFPPIVPKIVYARRALVGYDQDIAFSHRERILAHSVANVDSHRFHAEISMFLTYVITVNGIFLRFAITLGQRYKFYHFDGRFFDVFTRRRIHIFLGILNWFFARLACVTGTAIHELVYGSILFILLIVETIIALSLFVLYEVVYRIQMKTWAVTFTMRPVKSDKDTRMILHLLREKCKII